MQFVLLFAQKLQALSLANYNFINLYYQGFVDCRTSTNTDNWTLKASLTVGFALLVLNLRAVPLEKLLSPPLLQSEPSCTARVSISYIYQRNVLLTFFCLAFHQQFCDKKLFSILVSLLEDYLKLAQFLNKRRLWFCKGIKEHILLSISILIHKSYHGIRDNSSVVTNTKLLVPISSIIALHKVSMCFKFWMKVGEVSRITSLK